MAEPNQNPNENEEVELEEQEEGATGNESETPKSDPKQKESQEEQEEELEISQDPVEQEEQQEQEKPVSRRESKRIQQLLDKFAQNDEARYSPKPQQRPQQRRTSTGQIIPEGEYDLSEINGMAQEYGEGMFQQGLSQAQALTNANTFATRLEIDAPRINGKYEFLDKESDDFNPGVAAFVNRMYLNTVGYNPQTGVVQNSDLRYGEFVEGFMEAMDLISAGKVADSNRNVADQAARTGIRPGGTRKPAYQGSDPRKMTDEQLDAAIAASLHL